VCGYHKILSTHVVELGSDLTSPFVMAILVKLAARLHREESILPTNYYQFID